MASVGSGMRIARRSSFTIVACVLLLFSLTVVRGSSPPGWGLPLTLACTVMSPVPTPNNTSNTVRPSGRPFFLRCTMGFSSTQIDQQMEEAFGPHLLSLQYKRPVDSDQSTASRESKTAKGADGKGSGLAQDVKGKGKALGRGRGSRNPSKNKSGGSGWGSGSGFWNQQQTQSRRQDQDFIPDAQMCRLMARAIVDQADTIAVLRQSTAWVMWMQTTQPSLVPTLSATAALWKEKVSDDTSELFGLGLRVALIWSLLRTLRVTLESPSAELLSDARERKWIDQQGNWVYLRWNRSTRTLEPDEHRQPMNQTDLVSLLKTTGSLADGETVSRFAATRQLTASMEGVVTFKVDIQFRSPRAHQLYTNLESLAGLSPLCLLGISLRKESYRRPNGIQKLAEWCG